MISYKGDVVGSVWVDLVEKEGLPAPSVHMMIGDPNVRGKGVGFSSLKSVVGYLVFLGHEQIYSRHLTSNDGAHKLLTQLDFQPQGGLHTDEDGLEWQNVVRVVGAGNRQVV